MDNLRIVCESEQDTIRIIQPLSRKIWLETYDGILSAEQIAYMLKIMYSTEVMTREFAAGREFRIVYENDAPVGYLSWHFKDARTMQLDKVYLLSACHGRGVGSAMLQCAISAARKYGAQRIFLNVHKRNTRAHKAYFRNGFQITKSVITDFGNGYVMDDYVMQLDLPR